MAVGDPLLQGRQLKEARDYPSLLIRPHSILGPVLSSLIHRKGTSKWEQIQQRASQMVGALVPRGCAEGAGLVWPGEKVTLGAPNSHPPPGRKPS